MATARTPARVWILPAVGGLPLLLGGAPRPVGGSGPGIAPGFGVHPQAAYPPLFVPPGVPPSTADDGTDRRFERKLWWLLILLLLFALLLTGLNLVTGLPAWSEMPADHALLTAQRGTVAATVGGRPVTLHKGEKVYVSATDRVNVHDRSSGQLTFRGGSVTVLCGDSQVTVGPLASRGTPVAPIGLLRLDAGRLLADTATTSSAFLPLSLTVASGNAQANNSGAARFQVEAGDVDASSGLVSWNGTRLPATGDTLSCGDGAALPPPVDTPQPSPSDEPLPSDATSAPPSTSPSPSATPTGRTTPTPRTGTTTSPTPRASATTTKPSTSPASPPPPPDEPPTVVRGPTATDTAIFPSGSPCGDTTTIVIYVNDPDNTAAQLTVTARWTISSGKPASGSFGMRSTGNQSPTIWAFSGTLGPINYTGNGGNISVTVTVKDPAGKSAVSKPVSVQMATDCIT